MHSTDSNVPAVPWGWRDLILAIVLAALGILALNLAVLGLSLATGVSLRAGGSTLALFVIAQDLVVLSAALLFSVARHRAHWNTLGLRGFDVPLGCGLSATLFVLSYVARACYVVTMMGLGVELEVQGVVSLLDTRGGLWLTFVAVALFAPVVEEVFFRGFVYGGLRQRIGVIGATVGSTLLFTLLHFTLDQFVPIFILGLFLAWLYEKTGSLYPGIVLHAANNALALIALAIVRATGWMPI